MISLLLIVMVMVVHWWILLMMMTWTSCGRRWRQPWRRSLVSRFIFTPRLAASAVAVILVAALLRRGPHHQLGGVNTATRDSTPAVAVQEDIIIAQGEEDNSIMLTALEG